ncbi:gamma-glutamyl-gamma-aminobutyrate hydrolase family protein [Candidatus Kaiserbacteria bacterium]|nr:gamma-glutamyl-gamma-aminobutyrate hydrolase family protein [Candidatus Kaiserbacteria bacterium]MCB9817915.1 gamma-glutamyl-gamma-aminobutyrate hydrolase family protein [Candidatus Nomurabacteria bacterium]
MRPKILCIQFRNNKNSVEQEQASIEREAGVYTDVDFISATDLTINWNAPAELMSEYSGLILGGSGEFDFDGNREADDPAKMTTFEFVDRLDALFCYLFEEDVPTLGICYGHQLLGYFKGAQVKYDVVQKKTCSHEVKLVVDKEDHFLFSNLPDSFQAHYGHKDALDRVPEGAKLIMCGGDKCKVSALRYKNNIFTTQFHPEMNFEDMVIRIKNSPGYLPEGSVFEEIFKDDIHSNTILQNFSKFVAMKADTQVSVD